MTISLTPEQQAWLKAHVERGEFRSIDEAARQLIDERIAERMRAVRPLAISRHRVDLVVRRPSWDAWKAPPSSITSDFF